MDRVEDDRYGSAAPAAAPAESADRAASRAGPAGPACGSVAVGPGASVWCGVRRLVGCAWCVLSILLLGPWAMARAQAPQPPAAPVLRIEAGMHTALIGRIATDALGRWAVTASDDKTARVWALPSGRLLQVLRPPLADGREGMLYAVALSPDGAVVAVAGWAGLAWHGTNDIYLFDRASGRLLRRLGGHPNSINHLAFSPDGRWLAAVMNGNDGLRVWPWQRAGAEPLVDADYGNQTFGAQFGPTAAGRTTLVTSSFDGKLRLYQWAGEPRGRLEPLRTAKAPGGARPYGVAVSPDGRRLAVGYADSNRVDVLDASRLTWQFSPDTEGVAVGIAFAVAWSADGQTLAAAGTWMARDLRRLVRLWPDGGRGTPQDVPTAYNTLMDLQPLPARVDGGAGAARGWLVVAGDPTLGIVGSDRRWQVLGRPPVADLRPLDAKKPLLALEDGGRRIEFHHSPGDASSLRTFDLPRRQLSSSRLPQGQRPKLDGLDVADWPGTRPTLNGQPLKLEPSEESRSLALQHDRRAFVLGADWSLRAFGADGQPRWELPVPGVAWGVNIPTEGPRAGQLVVAAYGDGTIRWHRMSDGKELLAFFPHADRQRWVLWTPGGYYDAGPGAEDLIGWHVNRGVDQAADFFPASRFRERFYRPDVIDRVLETLDEAQAVAQADAARGGATPGAPGALMQALPPVVERLGEPSLNTTGPQVVVRVRGRSAADAPITGWRVRVNGELPPGLKNLEAVPAGTAGASAERSFDVPVPPGTSDVRVFAENRHGVSTAAVWQVQRTGAAATEPAFERRPRLFVLAIGVGQYQHRGVGSLGTLPAKDAVDFAAALQRQQGHLYREVHVKLLTDAQARRDEVLEALDGWRRQPTQFDVAALFISGHGHNDPTSGYMFLPVDANPERLRSTVVNWHEVRSTVMAMAGKRLVFMDTCHAGNVMSGGPGLKAPFNDITGVLNDLAAAENGVVVFSSSTGRQLSQQRREWGNGAFTKALVEGLDGQAAWAGRREITHKMLAAYVSERVRELTGGDQSPVNPDPVGVPDFPLAVVR